MLQGGKHCLLARGSRRYRRPARIEEARELAGRRTGHPSTATAAAAPATAPFLRVALLTGAGAAAIAARFFGFDAATIATRFTYRVRGAVGHGIPPLLPLPVLPWSLPGPGGKPLALSFAVLRELLPSVFAIAILGAVVHAAVVLLAVLFVAPLLGRLPMASLAALLLFVAWNMSEIDHFAHVLKAFE